MGEKDALVRNAADKSQVDEAGKREESKREQELNDIRFILNDVQGRRFLYRLVNGLCHYDADDFNNSGSITYFNLGERNIGRVVKSDAIEASLEAYHLMEKENWPFLKQGEKDAKRK